MELSRPLLLYDGDCAFCTSCARLLGRIAPRVEIAPFQSTDLSGLPVSGQEAREAVQWVGIDGTARAGHEAIAAALGGAGPIWRAAGRLILLPGISWLAARGYRLVAANRGHLSRFFRKLSGTA